MTDEELQEMIDEADRDGDGEVRCRTPVALHNRAHHAELTQCFEMQSHHLNHEEMLVVAGQRGRVHAHHEEDVAILSHIWEIRLRHTPSVCSPAILRSTLHNLD